MLVQDSGSSHLQLDSFRTSVPGTDDAAAEPTTTTTLGVLVNIVEGGT